MDKETESLWFPMEIDGEEGLVGIGGIYADRLLPRLQETCMIQLKWSDWKADNTDTKFVRE